MKFVSFASSAQEAPRPGVVVDERFVIDLAALPDAPFDNSSLLGLIEAGDAGLAWVRAVLAQPHERIALDHVHLFAPIPKPRKNVFCVGWNYLAHFEEGDKTRAAKVDLPDRPTFFTKASTAVGGPYDPIPIDDTITLKLDWEAELGVIIGKRGKNIAQAAAMDHVWGYTVLNDVTGRDIQRQHGNQWFKGKSLDGSCPMGPWIVTADALDPADLKIACRVNGVVKQSSSTSHMYFRIPRILEELSHGLTLEPGDIIASGTPEGVGHARVPPEFMQQGDVMETEVIGIGTLRNVIGPARG
ncbi:fumarylacetoacetate hydrolase family protein [Variovorax sp. PBL-E5]|uniref:fumarylacetoacetate hydrolase family protein n=1 Tax=Variovorax sp. PBL-E5 TaxID=434014 RepID=UPI00131742B4|nr:fumarylacetoacetate hydrolase family protein [Variovorax sp. PBL-E5]VTU33705.1 Ureidoglycolate lyase [Variovorax sp. PBL-E5]